MADAKDNKDKPAAGGKSPAAQKKRETKISRWTLEMCQKYARRFDHEDAWKHGAPSSYKAAIARGFGKDCMKHMTGAAKPKKVAAPKKTAAAKGKGKSSGRAA